MICYKMCKFFLFYSNVLNPFIRITTCVASNQQNWELCVKFYNQESFVNFICIPGIIQTRDGIMLIPELVLQRTIAIYKPMNHRAESFRLFML